MGVLNFTVSLLCAILKSRLLLSKPDASFQLSTHVDTVIRSNKPLCKRKFPGQHTTRSAEAKPRPKLLNAIFAASHFDIIETIFTN